MFVLFNKLPWSSKTKRQNISKLQTSGEVGVKISLSGSVLGLRYFGQFQFPKRFKPNKVLKQEWKLNLSSFKKVSNKIMTWKKMLQKQFSLENKLCFFKIHLCSYGHSFFFLPMFEDFVVNPSTELHFRTCRVTDKAFTFASIVVILI